MCCDGKIIFRHLQIILKYVIQDYYKMKKRGYNIK